MITSHLMCVMKQLSYDKKIMFEKKKRYGVKVGPGPRDPEPPDPGTRDPPQSLKAGPGTLLKFKSGTSGPPSKFKSGTPSPFFSEFIFSEYFTVFFAFLFLYLF